MKIIFVLLLLFQYIFLFSCNNSTDIPNETDPSITYSSEPVYATEELYYDSIFRFTVLQDSKGEDLTTYNRYPVGDCVHFLNWSTEHPGQMSFDIYNRDGQLIESDPIPEAVLASMAVRDERGEEIAYVTMETKNAFSRKFVRYDSAWNIIEESKAMPISYQGSLYMGMRFIGEDLIFYSDYTMYLFPDADLSAAPKCLKLPCLVSDIMSLENGELLLCGPSDDVFGTISAPLFYDLNIETGKSEQHQFADGVTDPTALFNRAREVTMHNNTLYGNCADGLYVLRDGAPVQLIDWNESAIDCRVIRLLDVFSDTCFLVNYENPLEYSTELCILRLTDEVRTTPREIFTVATIGLPDSQQVFLNTVIYMFNRQNNDYKIEYHNYYAQEDDYSRRITSGHRFDEEFAEAAQRQFEEDLLSGIVYDCYIFPESSTNRDLLADKGLLADLSPFLEEDQLLGCVETSYQTDDGIIALPYFMKLSTLITSQSVLSSQKKLTYDGLIEIANNLAEDESLLTEQAYTNLKKTGVYEFLDFDNQTCSFDSDAGKAWLTFLMEVRDGEYSLAELDLLHTIPVEFASVFTTHDIYAVSPFAPFDIIRTDDVKFTEITFDGYKSIAAAHWLYRYKTINYCGYPSEDETAGLLSTDATFSVSSVAGCPEGANAFLQYLLSAEIQSCSYAEDFGLPVSREGMMAVFPMDYIHFCLRELGSGTENDPWFHTRPDAFWLNILVKEEEMNDLNKDANSVFDVMKLTEEDRDRFIRFLDRAVMRTAADATLQSILDEELSYVESGVRSPEEAGKILQSRVGIYLAE